MEVHFSPDVEMRLQQVASANGKDAEQLVKETVSRMPETRPASSRECKGALSKPTVASSQNTKRLLIAPSNSKSYTSGTVRRTGASTPG
jgi:hypothetical protein